MAKCKKKQFGIHLGGNLYKWYDIETKRDQALPALKRTWSFSEFINPKPINR